MHQRIFYHSFHTNIIKYNFFNIDNNNKIIILE